MNLGTFISLGYNTILFLFIMLLKLFCFSHSIYFILVPVSFDISLPSFFYFLTLLSGTIQDAPESYTSLPQTESKPFL